MDPFKSHLVALLSIYELGQFPGPQYEGYSDWQTEAILKSLATVARRMWTAEETVAALKAALARANSATTDNSAPAHACCPTCGNSVSDSTLGSETLPLSSSPLVVPIGLVSPATSENGMSAVEELRLLKAQLSDVARVCNAVARGDLSRKITTPVQGVFMVQLKDVINTMVVKICQFSKEATRVTHEVGIDGKLGGQAKLDDMEGAWADLTHNINKMASNQTDQVRSISEVIKAIDLGDLGKLVNVDVQGEMLDLNMTINSMVTRLGTLANEVSRVSLEVGTEGILGGQASVADVQGLWKVLTDSVNLMAMNLTNQVRSIAEVTKAIASGDLTMKIEVDVRGEVLELKKTINGMSDNLSVFVGEVTRVAREVGIEGRLGGQARATNVGGIWKDLMDNVNAMAYNLTLQVRTIAVVTTAVARGDLTQKITDISLSGEMLSLFNTINDVIDELAMLVAEVNKVAESIRAEGELGVLAELRDPRGAWQEIKLFVDTMACNLTTQLRGFKQIPAAALDGDFTWFNTVETVGEIDSLKSQIHQMASKLHKNIQENSAARAAAELANKRNNEFLANITHETRTPVNGIIGMSELALDDDLTRSQRENLLQIHSLARSLLLIIDDVLVISKIDAGLMTMESVSYSLRQTVFGILKTLAVRASANNLDLIYNVESDIPDQLVGDTLRLRQVITNLVGNAIRFTPSRTPQRSYIALSIRLLSLNDQSVTLEFCVTDTGTGIAKHKLDLIFDTIYQVGGSTIREYGGTGLGLPVSKRLVSFMQGDMWVESEVGKGSKFFFTIMSQISHLTMEATLAKMVAYSKRTILYVDTVFDRSDIVQQILDLDLKPYVIHGVSEVADKQTCPHIDTIIVDSLKVSESIREIEHLRFIPIVLLVPSNPPPLNLKWCLDNGISSQVTKPISAQDLSSALIFSLEANTVYPTLAPDDVSYDILLAEDNFFHQKIAVKILEKSGHTVQIAENGSLAVDAFKDRHAQGKPFDVILMNMFMPSMGGMEATALIRSYEIDRGLTVTPIIALSAYAKVGEKVLCLQAGMDDHITKPIHRGTLINAINKLVGERRAEGISSPS